MLIDTEIKSLQEGYNLTNDGEPNDYVGTSFTRLSDGSIELYQPCMVEHVLQMVGLNDVSDRTKMHDTSAISTNLLYNDTLQQHEDAVKLICRYLLRTKENGLVLRPDKSRSLKCIFDAD